MALWGLVPQILAIIARDATGVAQVQGTVHKAGNARPDSGIRNQKARASLISL